MIILFILSLVSYLFIALILILFYFVTV